MSSAVSPHESTQRLNQILDPSYPLCKDDVVWALEFVKRKMAEQDPRLLSLPPARLLTNAQAFADIATTLIQRRPCGGPEAETLRAKIREATYGLRS